MIFVSRSEWGAAPRTNAPGRLSTPEGVTFHWGGNPTGIKSHADCARKVRAYQRYHQKTRKWADIAYNLLACPHGYVFEGRGLFARSAANGTNTGNARHYAVCYLGGEGEPLTMLGKAALADARAYLQEKGRAGSEIRPHGYWKKTGCPGPWIITWINQGAPHPTPAEPQKEAPDMYLAKDPNSPMQFTIAGNTKKHVRTWAALVEYEKRGVPRLDLDAAELASYPTVEIQVVPTPPK